MRRINPNKVRVVMLRDSTTKTKSLATWDGETVRLWVKHEDMKPVEIFVLDDNEPDPEPQVGFGYGRGIIA